MSVLSQFSLQNAFVTEFGKLSSSTAIADAFGNYFRKSSLAGVNPVPAQVLLARDEMAAALVLPNDSTPAQAAGVIAASLGVFWVTLAAAASTVWPAATVITPPPGIAALSDSLISVLQDNASQDVTLSQAADALAAVIHPAAGTGGTALIGGVATPIS